MTAETSTPRLGPEETAALCSLLAQEEREYRRLRRLAWRQTAYLKRRDAVRLERNAQEWRQFLPVADAARRAREDGLQALAQRLGTSGSRLSAEDLLTRVEQGERDAVRAAIRLLAHTAGELYRQNGLNVMLAKFCLDLVAQETAIFRQCVLGDPAGCYVGDGQRATATGACLMQHRA